MSRKNERSSTMIKYLAKNQNWAKATPFMGIIATILLFLNYDIKEPMFWVLVNIPLYLFHQLEEHLWPGGFKDYINQNVNHLSKGEEALTDEKVFWINIVLVWLSFAIIGVLSFVNIGFGIIIIIFSIVNCISHIVEGLKSRKYNPGLVMATLQFLLSLYGAYYVTTMALTSPLFWWVAAIVFSAVVHVLLFKLVMTKK